ncbi:MAG: geranylgeranyl reductase family protein, partial [Bacteroidales bacterium]|nr:geranylgeranyl reductase family protein [Bacteroidales bacterium]
CAAALGLGKSGLKVALIDKAVFPREKTCGDAIPGPAIKTLNKTFPFFQEEFCKLKEKHRISSSSIILNNGRSIDYHWKLPAYNIKRSLFDAFLLELVRKYASVDILTGWLVSEINPGTPHLIKSNKAGTSINAKLIIGCDGAGSITAKTFQQPATSNQQPVIAVRAYYKGVKLSPDTNYFYVSNKYLPGYFWAFPLGDDVFNVGFGMKTDRAGKVPLKMKEVLSEFIQSKQMKNAFAGSQQLSASSGAIIPIGGKRGSYSGDGYLLTGDSALLADPLQGHGIDKAIVSGLLAARHTANCFKEDDFSAEFNADYDLSIKNGIERELRKNRQKQLMLTMFPFLLHLYAMFRK